MEQWRILSQFSSASYDSLWFIWFIGICCKYYSDLFRKYITNDSGRQTGNAFSPTSTAMAMAASTLDGSWHAKAKISQRNRISALPAVSWVVKTRGLGPKMLRVTSQGEDLRRNWTWDWNCSVLHSEDLLLMSCCWHSRATKLLYVTQPLSNHPKSHCIITFHCVSCNVICHCQASKP